jgi:hypothetical protein
MDMSQLLRALGLQQAYQAYQQNIGQPFANVAGPFGRGLLGLDKPEYGEEQAYRTGQAVGNMPAVGAPVGAFKAAAQVPGLLVDATQMAKQMGPELAGLLGLTAFHGSPHRFSKFDASKIGTGEGAQAYGHGLYFAENPEIAGQYKVSTSANQYETNLGTIRSSDLVDAIIKNSGQINPQLQSAYQAKANEVVRDLIMGEDAQSIAKAIRQSKYSNMYKGLADAVESINPVKAKGQFYTVDIPDKMVGKMLDWDKPLSQQSQTVMDALQKSGLIADVERVGSVAAEKVRQLAQQPRVAEWAKRDLMKDAEQLQISKSPKHVAGVLKRMQMDYGISPDSGPFSDVAGDFLSFVKGMQAVPNMDTGGGAISFLQAMYGNAGASQKLREAGIPGIRYLDQGSRGSGQGTRNFVVFPGEEEALKMLSVE